MVILVTSKYNNPKYLNLVQALKHKKVDIRFSFVVNQEIINEIKPDLMISDHSNQIGSVPHLLLYDKDTDLPSDMGYSLNDIPPFINPEFFNRPEFKPYYESDFTFIGNPNNLNSAILPYLNMDYKVKFFGPVTQIWCYCGVLSDDQVQHAYFSAKYPIALEGDIQSHYNIVMSNKRPLVIKDPEDIQRAMKGTFHKSMRKEDIIRNHTNLNRMNWLINKFKLKII